jgi:hypothetical protein
MTYDKTKFKFKLYAPDKIKDVSVERLGKFHIDDFRGLYASQEFAERAGKIKKWYQIIDANTNKVIKEHVSTRGI